MSRKPDNWPPSINILSSNQAVSLKTSGSSENEGREEEGWEIQGRGKEKRII